MSSESSDEYENEDESDNDWDDGDEVMDSESERDPTQTSGGSRSTVANGSREIVAGSSQRWSMGTARRSTVSRAVALAGENDLKTVGQPKGVPSLNDLNIPLRMEGRAKRARMDVREGERNGAKKSVTDNKAAAKEEVSDFQGEDEGASDEDGVLCFVCKSADEEDFLLCDGVGPTHGAHMSCMKPKIESVPRGKWFCDACKGGNFTEQRGAKNRKAQHSEKLVMPQKVAVEHGGRTCSAGKENNPKTLEIKQMSTAPAADVNTGRRTRGNAAQGIVTESTVTLRPVSIPHVGGFIGGQGRYRMGLSRNATLPRLHNPRVPP